MSADDGVYIIKLRSIDNKHEHAYRIVRTQAIENILNSRERILNAFADSPVFHDYNTALKIADYLDQKDFRTEYGVMVINQYKEKTWDELVNVPPLLN